MFKDGRRGGRGCEANSCSKKCTTSLMQMEGENNKQGESEKLSIENFARKIFFSHILHLVC